jgi:glycosyltransferase involved in cell wall biosynthesis
LVSVIIPFKNPMPYFEDCLNSILNQSYNNLQIILVNDGSIDNSLDIANKFKLRDPRIKVLKNDGIGIIDALNTGSKLANGRFISRMDADDLMSETKIEDLRNKLLEKKDAYIAIGKVSYFSSDKDMGSGYLNYAEWLNTLTTNTKNFEELYKECTIPSSAWMMERKHFEKINGFNDLTYPEDYHFAFKLFYAGIKLTATSRIVHLWRDHPKRTSRNSKIYQFKNFITLKLKYFIEFEWKQKGDLVLWGAGKKGKKIAEELLKNRKQFKWISNNKNKIGHFIYNQKIESEELLKNESEKIIICAISEKQFTPPINTKFNSFFNFY